MYIYIASIYLSSCVYTLIPLIFVPLLFLRSWLYWLYYPDQVFFLDQEWPRSGLKHLLIRVQGAFTPNREIFTDMGHILYKLIILALQHSLWHLSDFLHGFGIKILAHSPFKQKIITMWIFYNRWILLCEKHGLRLSFSTRPCPGVLWVVLQHFSFLFPNNSSNFKGF